MAVPYQSTGSLRFKGGQFILDDKPFRILSGTMHYFRVHPHYWRDRLVKMKACWLNTVETYVPWNQHEEYPGKFNFEGFLDVRKFIQVAYEVGLYVIFRPGPYICAEWDLGGLPAWLLADENMKIRSNYRPYQEAVERFFGKILPLVTDLQHSDGGPIIAVQIENEFGSYSDEITHLVFIKELLLKYGVKELLLTSENIFGLERGLFHEHALPTGNFPEMGDGQKIFDMIRKLSPDFPLMVTEFWPGWFDHWGSKHKGLSMEKFEACLNGILDAGGSFNMYMFHGGTNFGFMAGANKFPNSTYKPDVTSYDYDAPLSEAGDITEKFLRAKEIILSKVLRPQGITKLLELPPNTKKADYGQLNAFECLRFEDLLKFVNPIECSTPVNMEKLKLHNGLGQNHGYILYRTNIPAGELLTFTNKPADRTQVFISGSLQDVIDWKTDAKEITICAKKDVNRLDILVENHGRINYIEFGSNILNEERKGVRGSVFLDGKEIENWNVFPLEFKQDFVERLVTSPEWQPISDLSETPAMFKTGFTIEGAPADTFLNMKNWGKGVVFINGFNLGRYWSRGPQQTLYIPAPLMTSGYNQIVIFEQEGSGDEMGPLYLQDFPILDDLNIPGNEESQL